MEEKGKPGIGTLKRRIAGVKKVHPSKVYDYIRKVEIDGLPRIRAYAEAIDPTIYELEPGAAHRKLDRMREDYPAYDDVKAMVLAEESEWAKRKSHAAQDKAVSLLLNTIDKANKLLEDPEADAKSLVAANNVLRTIMPAITAVNTKADMVIDNSPKIDKKARASKYIN